MASLEKHAPTSCVRAKITEGGRIVIPASYRRSLGVDVGDEVLMQLDDRELRIYTVDQAVRRAQELVARYVPGDRSLADELIAERRLEAERE